MGDSSGNRERSPEATSPAVGESRLAALEERFYLHWGEMANAWGINRTMGQIHALLYISPRPLTADDLMHRLQISRGNVSMSLRSLEEWGVVQRLHYTGDRREHYRSVGDVWVLFHTIVQERKRREFDPMLRSLREFLNDAVPGEDAGLAHYRTQLGELLAVLETLDSLFSRMLPRDPRDLPRVLEVQVEGLEE